MISNEHLNECYQHMWKRTYQFLNKIRLPDDFSASVVRSVVPVRAFVDDEHLPTVIFKVFMDQSLRNHYGNAHGGALTTLLDILTWQGLFAEPGLWDETRLPTDEEVFKIRKNPTVSRKINVRFARPVELDREYFVTVKIITNSKNGAFISARIHDEAGKTFVFGIQDIAKLVKSPASKPNL